MESEYQPVALANTTARAGRAYALTRVWGVILKQGDISMDVPLDEGTCVAVILCIVAVFRCVGEPVAESGSRGIM